MLIMNNTRMILIGTAMLVLGLFIGVWLRVVLRTLF